MDRKIILTLSMLICLLFNLNATKRTIPVDMVLMIDKSISMQEAGRFDNLKEWVLDELIDQIIINGDWISIYQFYEKPEHLVSLNIQNENDRNTVINTISSVKPDGKFTDIGRALDEINEVAKKRKGNNRYKILLIITDLEQDAPLSSKYAGKQKKFSSPYLAESRIIKHKNWYEITLDMSIQDTVVKTTKELFFEITQQIGKDRVEADQKEVLIKNKNN